MESEPKNEPVGDRSTNGETGTPPARQPYDSSEIEKLPYPTRSDPPYRPFWVDGNET